MTLIEHHSYCHRVEERTIIPGVIIVPDPRYPNEITEQNILYIIVQGSTERYLGKSGTIYARQEEIMTSDYFTDAGNAVDQAIELHVKKGCQAPGCNWRGLK